MKDGELLDGGLLDDVFSARASGSPVTAVPELNLDGDVSRVTLRTATPARASGAARFVGAKRGEGVWQRIISEMPRHRIFVEDETSGLENNFDRARSARASSDAAAWAAGLPRHC